MPQTSSPEFSRRPLVVALATQLGAGAIVLAAAWAVATAAGAAGPVFAWTLVQGTLATVLGWRFGLPGWWLPIQFLLPPLVVVGGWLPVPPWIYLLIFVALLLVYWNSAGERVPLYLTNRRTWAALDGILPKRDDLAMVDLGCGLGGTLAYLCRHRPAARIHGIESAPVPFVFLWLRLRLFGPKGIVLHYGDFWDFDLSPFDAVYCFLSPAPMERLLAKARREMRPATQFISNSFTVPGVPADDVVRVDDRRNTELHVWRM